MAQHNLPGWVGVGREWDGPFPPFRPPGRMLQPEILFRRVSVRPQVKEDRWETGVCRLFQKVAVKGCPLEECGKAGDLQCLRMGGFVYRQPVGSTAG